MKEVSTKIFRFEDALKKKEKWEAQPLALAQVQQRKEWRRSSWEQKMVEETRGKMRGDSHKKRTEEMAERWREKQERRKVGIFCDPKRLEEIDPHLWSVADVMNWLKSNGLQSLCETFNSNDIDGCALLEISNQDLNSFGIRALAIRKLLMKKIQTLRSPENIPQKPAGTKHWSEIKPLRENEVQCPQGFTQINLADGVYDETKARLEFQEAVEQWRSSQAKAQEKESLLATFSGKEGEMWENPFF